MVKEFFEDIWNGIKRAVKFVVDVLLFIPRLIIKGVKCAIAWLEKDDEESPSVELVEKKVEEKEVNVPSSSNTSESKVVPFAAAGVALGAAAAAAEPAKKETVEPEKGEAEVAKNETPVTETATEVENDDEERSSKTKKSTKKPSVKVEKVAAEVVDTKTGEVITPVEVFGNTDKKASQYENAFVRYYNEAKNKYGKGVWMDGAIELQKFARSFLDALAIKEGIAPLKGVAADKRYTDLLAKLDAKVKFSDDEKKKLAICLGCQNCMGTEAVKPQMDVALRLIDMYQSHYYEVWYKTAATTTM